MNEKKEEFYGQIGVAMTCRSYDEYLVMFNLQPHVLERGPILDVAAGASSFAAGAASRGYKVIAADPLYAMSPDQIRDKGFAEIEESTAKLASLQHKFDWTYYESIDRHKAGRETALQLFAHHFAEQTAEQPTETASSGAASTDGFDHHYNPAYVPAYLPKLPFADDSFSLVLCSHFLFLYEEQFDAAFHEAALLELLRVCRPDGEVRVYPLLSLRWEPYPHLEEIIRKFKDRGIACRLEQSNLPFIPGSTHMLIMQPLTSPLV
jgi:SAM-dependent methyltransferase